MTTTPLTPIKPPARGAHVCTPTPPAPAPIVYLAISPPTHGAPLQVACSYAPFVGGKATATEALALDLLNAARKRGADVAPTCTHGAPQPLLLINLARTMLNPDELGHTVGPVWRDVARMALGMPPSESMLRTPEAAQHPHAQTARVVGTTAHNLEAV